jgi:signal transduction histidine kinase
MPFVTSKKDGTGIGLNICETIVHRHGGAIWARHNVDHGLTFQVRLPLEPSVGGSHPSTDGDSHL